MNWVTSFFTEESKETQPKAENHKEGISEQVHIFASIESCLDIITDYDHYAEFLTDLSQVKIVSTVDDNTVDVLFSVSIMLYSIEYTLRLTRTENGVVWRKEGPGPFETNNGSWKLEKVDDNKVLATYTVDCEFNIWVPSMVRDFVVGSRLPATLEAFKVRIEENHRNKNN